LRASTLATVTKLFVTLPEDLNIGEIEHEIVVALADRLRDDHGYGLAAGVSASAVGDRNEYPLQPSGSILVEEKPGALRVKLRGVNADARDLFTGLSSELELRHEGLRIEIG